MLSSHPPGSGCCELACLSPLDQKIWCLLEGELLVPPWQGENHAVAEVAAVKGHSEMLLLSAEMLGQKEVGAAGKSVPIGVCIMLQNQGPSQLVPTPSTELWPSSSPSKEHGNPPSRNPAVLPAAE